MSAGKGQKGRGEEGIRGWDGWMASPMQWTRTWANFRRRWGTGRSAVLQFMGSPRVGHDWMTEQQQQSFISSWKTRIHPSSICWVSTRCHIYIYTHIYMCMLSCFSHVLLFATLWTVTCQVPVSMRYSREEYWSGLPCPPPRDLPNPGMEPMSLVCLALQAYSLLLNHQGSPYMYNFNIWKFYMYIQC